MSIGCDMNQENLNQLKQNLINILNQVGKPDTCKGCHVVIYWIKHKNGKMTPYTENGLNHLADCPVSDRFRKTK